MRIGFIGYHARIVAKVDRRVNFLRGQDCGSQHGDTNHCDASDAEPDDAQPDDARAHVRPRMLTVHALGVALAHANPRALPHTHGAGRRGGLWVELSGEECALDSSDITPALWRRLIGV